MVSDHGTRSTTVRGLVVAREWDADGRPIKVAIAASGEREFEVDPAGAGTALLAHLRREVVAAGTLRTAADGRPLLVVSSVSVLAEPPPAIDHDPPLAGA